MVSVPSVTVVPLPCANCPNSSDADLIHSCPSLHLLNSRYSAGWLVSGLMALPNNANGRACCITYAWLLETLVTRLCEYFSYCGVLGYFSIGASLMFLRFEVVGFVVTYLYVLSVGNSSLNVTF